MFPGVGYLHCTYDLHQALFSLSLDDMYLEASYGRLCNIGEEIDLCEPHFENLCDDDATRVYAGCSVPRSSHCRFMFVAKKWPLLRHLFHQLLLPLATPCLAYATCLLRMLLLTSTLLPLLSIRVNVLVLPSYCSVCFL